MNVVEQKLFAYEAEHKGGVIVEIPMLLPIPKTQLEMADLLIRAGIDIIQIPIPVRFPWMYAKRILSIQKMAAENKIWYKQSFQVLEELIKRYPETEFMPVGFYGGLQRMGQENYVRELARLGIHVADVPDYPLVHDRDPRGLGHELEKRGINLVTVISADAALSDPGTDGYKHLEKIVSVSHGFCFLLATAGGKTGERDDMDYERLAKAKEGILRVQEKTGRRCPIVAVCGISTPEQVRVLTRELGLHVMFGSALFTRMMNGESKEDIYRFLIEMKKAATETR